MLRRGLANRLFLLYLLLSVDGGGAEGVTDEMPPKVVVGDAAAPSEAADDLPLLECKPNELLEKIDSWSVDCVALWLENLGFPELRSAFVGNKMDGGALKALTMEKLADDYGVSDINQRKKIYYNLKDVLRKDSSSGNTNHYSQMLFWCLPFLGLYKWITLKYDKQIAKAMKRYKKWQEARNPPKPPEPVVFADGTNEWISGVNGDVVGNSGKPNVNKKDKKEKDKKKPKSARVD